MKKYSVPIKNHLSLLQETWDRAYQDGYAKGRVRCLEQHRGEELREDIKKILNGKSKEIKEIRKTWKPCKRKNCDNKEECKRANHYIETIWNPAFEKILSILKKNDNEC